MIYALFVIDKTIPNEWTGKELVREVKEEVFGSFGELRKYVREFSKIKGCETVEQYKGLHTEYTYVYRVVIDETV